jgi:hypothetical protein
MLTSDIPGLLNGTLMEGASIKELGKPATFLLPPDHFAGVIAASTIGFLVQDLYVMKNSGFRKAFCLTLASLQDRSLSKAEAERVIGSLSFVLDVFKGAVGEAAAKADKWFKYVDGQMKREMTIWGL